jgi:ubiquitin
VLIFKGGISVESKDIKLKVKNLAAELARQEVERTGKDYHKCISNALDEACERMGIKRKEYIRLFI